MLNVVSMIITKKRTIEYKQKKMRKECKCFATNKSTKHKRRQ